MKDTEVARESVMGVLPSSSIWDVAVFACFELLYSLEKYSKLMIMQMILFHRKCKLIVSSEMQLFHEPRR